MKKGAKDFSLRIPSHLAPNFKIIFPPFSWSFTRWNSTIYYSRREKHHRNAQLNVNEDRRRVPSIGDSNLERRRKEGLR